MSGSRATSTSKTASQRGRASRDKGKRFERQIAALLRDRGLDAHRGVQYHGGPDSPDVTGLPGYHIECKAVERLNVHEAFQQSVRDAGEGEVPLVVHKKSREDILVTLRFSDFLDLLEGKRYV